LKEVSNFILIESFTNRYLLILSKGEEFRSSFCKRLIVPSVMPKKRALSTSNLWSGNSLEIRKQLENISPLEGPLPDVIWELSMSTVFFLDELYPGQILFIEKLVKVLDK
jgi:hypothetical protein